MSQFDVAGFLYAASYFLIPLVFAITVHEVAHGWVARRCGDPTAAMAGRLTLNPLKHIDPLGTLIVPIGLWIVSSGSFVFGWAKPVPVAFQRLRNPKRDMILVAVAGPGVNLVMALIWAIFLNLQGHVALASGFVSEWLFRMAEVGIMFNVILAVFNMLPIPPLDGGRVLAGLAPPSITPIINRIEPFGILIVLALLYFDALWPIIGPVFGFFMDLYGQVSLFAMP